MEDHKYKKTWMYLIPTRHIGCPTTPLLPYTEVFDTVFCNVEGRTRNLVPEIVRRETSTGKPFLGSEGQLLVGTKQSVYSLGGTFVEEVRGPFGTLLTSVPTVELMLDYFPGG